MPATPSHVCQHIGNVVVNTVTPLPAAWCLVHLTETVSEAFPSSYRDHLPEVCPACAAANSV
jgi:hypothetical protein